MAQIVSQIQGELLTFWNNSITSLSTQGETAREEICRKLVQQPSSALYTTRKHKGSFQEAKRGFGAKGSFKKSDNPKPMNRNLKSFP